MTTTLEGLQAALAGEHAAVWILAVLGARTSVSQQPGLASDLTRTYVGHRAARDLLVAAVRDLGVQPEPSAVAYELPGPALTPAQVRDAAATVERRCSGVYADLVASTVGDQRRWAVTALTQSAIRELTFRESPEIFPGVGELADR